MFQSIRRPDGAIYREQVCSGWALHDRQGALSFVEQEEHVAVILPSKVLAERVIAEWQGDQKREYLSVKADRPATQIARLALLGCSDRHSQREATIAQIQLYCSSDTIGYFQAYPEGLLQRQQEQWLPIWEWCRSYFGAAPEPEFGLAALTMPTTVQKAIAQHLDRLDPFSLAALNFIVALSGSIVLGLAQQVGYIDAERAYQLANLESVYQQEKWGDDDELSFRLARQKYSFVLAQDFFDANSTPERIR